MVAIGLLGLVDSFIRFAVTGLGTPAPILPTRSLVVSGLYRYVRNPMYVAVLSIIVGQGIVLGNLAVLAYGTLVCAMFTLFVRLYEEPRLAATFGVNTTSSKLTSLVGFHDSGPGGAITMCERRIFAG